jgi:glyoxylase-like metal-dependent hydrolase (beta-lactamase superfamily II)
MTKPVELAPNVYRIGTMGSAINSVLFVESNGELTLVDAGLKSAPRSIVSAIEHLGKKSSDVTRIVLTHAHPDHAGGLKRMQDRSGARVITHEVDAPYVEAGKVPARDQRNFLARVLGMLPGNSFEPCHIDEQIVDGQLLDVGGGLRVVHTPGHSPGHVSLLHEKTGVLIVGDALFNATGLTFSLKWACSDIPLSRETAGRLGDLDFEVATFMHGAEIRENARARIKEFIARKLGR